MASWKCISGNLKIITGWRLLKNIVLTFKGGDWRVFNKQWLAYVQLKTFMHSILKFQLELINWAMRDLEDRKLRCDQTCCKWEQSTITINANYCEINIDNTCVSTDEYLGWNQELGINVGRLIMTCFDNSCLVAMSIMSCHAMSCHVKLCFPGIWDMILY